MVGGDHVLTDPDVTGSYAVDWTGRFRGAAPAVVRPGAVAEVAAVLRICNAARAAVVPQGGNTGLVGGSVPLHGEIVLSLRRLDTLGPVDPRAAQVVPGADAAGPGADHHDPLVVHRRAAFIAVHPIGAILPRPRRSRRSLRVLGVGQIRRPNVAQAMRTGGGR